MKPKQTEKRNSQPTSKQTNTPPPHVDDDGIPTCHRDGRPCEVCAYNSILPPELGGFAGTKA